MIGALVSPEPVRSRFLPAFNAGKPLAIRQGRGVENGGLRFAEVNRNKAIPRLIAD